MIFRGVNKGVSRYPVNIFRGICKPDFLADFEKPSSIKFSVLKTFASYVDEVLCLFSLDAFLVHIAKCFKEVFP